MDPQATWNEMLDALKRRQWDEADQHAADLYSWMNSKQGFAPLTIGDESLGKEWHRTIASFTCLFVQTKVKEIRIRRARKQQASQQNAPGA